MTRPPWYARAFQSDYLHVYAHRSAEQARQQVAAMQRCGLLPAHGRVLDIACGAGRHLHAMAQAGLNAYGLDYSLALLQAGKLAGQAVRADMREIPFAARSFDWACSLFTSFGYFDSSSEDLRVFRGAAHVLRPGGHLVLDHMNPSVTIRNLQPLSDQQGDGWRLVQRRRHEHETGRILKEVEYTRQGRTERWQECVRLYPPRELEAMLTAAGFELQSRYGDLDGSRWEPDASPRQVLLVRSRI